MPRLNLALLQQAGAETAGAKGGTHRTNVRDVFTLASEFNQNFKNVYTEPEEHAQIKRLDSIMEAAGGWLTSKSPKREGPGVTPDKAIDTAKAVKNEGRWKALAEICTQCADELIVMGYRPLAGRWPGDVLHPAGAGVAASAHANYWLERLDPKHRSSTAMKDAYEAWTKLPADSPDFGKGFFTYVDEKRKDIKTSVRYDKDKGAADADVRRQRRRESQVVVQAGKLHRLDAAGGVAGAYSTDPLKTEFAGPGFAIFVWDHKGRIFSGLHIANSLHHSTARGGRPVRCAGELRTDGTGTLVFLTSKTGHYTTTSAEFKTFLTHLAKEGALTGATLCVPDTSNQAMGSWGVYGALDWVGGGGARKTRQDVVNLIPGLATELKSRNFFLRLQQ